MNLRNRLKTKEKFLVMHGSIKFGVVLDVLDEKITVGGPMGARVDMERFITEVMEKELEEPVFRSVNKLAYYLEHYTEGMKRMKQKIETEAVMHGYMVYSGIQSFGRLMR